MYEDAQKLIESTLEKFDFVDHIAFFKDGYVAVKIKNDPNYAYYFGLSAAVEAMESQSKKVINLSPRKGALKTYQKKMKKHKLILTFYLISGFWGFLSGYCSFGWLIFIIGQLLINFIYTLIFIQFITKKP